MDPSVTASHRTSSSDDPCHGGWDLPRLYRAGIEGCQTRNAGLVRQVLMQLIGMLNFRYQDAAARLFEVYDDCLEQVQRRQFDVPQRVLESLEAAFGPPSPLAPAVVPRRRT
jgi:hypothetical protein